MPLPWLVVNEEFHLDVAAFLIPVYKYFAFKPLHQFPPSYKKNNTQHPTTTAEALLPFPGGTPENFAEMVKIQNQIGFFQLSFFILPVYMPGASIWLWLSLISRQVCDIKSEIHTILSSTSIEACLFKHPFYE